MAAGTVVSRGSGYVRNALLLAALGASTHADMFNIANTVPNMLYILLAGGVFNAVLVPQLVRAMTQDSDGGANYTNRIVTLAGLFLGGVTLLLILAAPLLMRVFLDRDFFTDPELREQRDAAIAFARLCLPQVWFYGMFVLVGQILNARGKFGPMMWAPITNNIVAIATLVTYLIVFGPARGAAIHGGFTSGQEWLLGAGSTLGIVVQFLVLVPFVRATGYRYRPRFDFVGTGLGHTMRLGVWTLLFVIVNQIAYSVVVRLASAGTTTGAGTGYTIYSNSYLVVMTPHSIITVSLATATLTALAAYARDGDHRAVAGQVSTTLRSALALILPFALILPLIALPVANLVSRYGAATDATEDFARTLTVFGIALVFFTCHYVVLRGFYALERNRTVFLVQCVIAISNIALAFAVTRNIDPSNVAPTLALAFGASYAVGALISYLVLRRTLGHLYTAETVRFGVRILIAGALAALATWGARVLLDLVADPGTSKLWAVTTLAMLAIVDLTVLVLCARAMRITELTDMVEMLSRRLRRDRRDVARSP
ncbi:MAG: murein biosynthesis integral membrane protein MurJ [Nocardioidaceae bacterium]|nr:MAG: murein biosynthesis integral membrane protein MurJ [Nocardioidaceae bacterium]